MYNNVLIVIFTFNEQKNISNVLKSVTKYFSNILVVDNNSTDNTLNEIKKFSVYNVQHKFNLGKSNSMKTGLNFAKIKNYKYIAFMDGDGQHKVEDLISVCDDLVEHHHDLVIGYRKNLSKLNTKKKIGTIILSLIFSKLYNKEMFDIQSGLRAFKVNNENIKWESSGLKHYFADAEITCNAIKNKCKVNQIPIETISSESYKGMNVVQGLYLLIMLFFWRML